VALTLPNVDRIAKTDVQLAEALKKTQDYVNSNVTPAAGNRQAPPPSSIGPKI